MPVVVRPRTTFGSLVAAMFVGALLAITGLYLWGADVAHDAAEQEAGAASHGE